MKKEPKNCYLSVRIPARNEAGNIAEAVACLLASERVEVELIVLDDGSTDGTADILRGTADPRLRVEGAAPLPLLRHEEDG